MSLDNFLSITKIRKKCDEIWSKCYDSCGHLYPEHARCVIDCLVKNNAYKICNEAYGGR